MKSHVDIDRIRSIEATWRLTTTTQGGPLQCAPHPFIAFKQVEELIAEVLRLRVALDYYGDHHDTCRVRLGRTPCTCGFSQVVP